MVISVFKHRLICQFYLVNLLNKLIGLSCYQEKVYSADNPFCSFHYIYLFSFRRVWHTTSFLSFIIDRKSKKSLDKLYNERDEKYV